MKKFLQEGIYNDKSGKDGQAEKESPEKLIRSLQSIFLLDVIVHGYCTIEEKKQWQRKNPCWECWL
jgi:hypothetical protein